MQNADYILSDEQEAALDLWLNQDDVRVLFLTGKAGTGKSFTAREGIRRARRRDIKLAVTAPTGTAALNVGGETLHRFLRIKPGQTTIGFIENGVVRKIAHLFVDEASMLRADMVDMLDKGLRETRMCEEPFGGVKVVFCGDLAQLPPVVTRDEKEYMSKRYASPYFFDSKAFQSCKFAVVELTKVFRQDGDRRFIQVLNAVREARNLEQTINYLNARCHTPADRADGVVLCSTNGAAADINDAELEKNKNKKFRFFAEISGNINPKDLPVPEVLTLCVGARAMVVRNLYEQREKDDYEDLRKPYLVNGDTGAIVGFVGYRMRDNGRDDFEALEHSEEGDDDLCNEDVSAIVFRADRDGQEYAIGPQSWEKFESIYDEKKDTLEKKVVGSFAQFPLVPAWAMTIHKSQGKTLQKVVVDLRRRMFDCGQLYVSLSRATSLEGLQILGRAEIRDVMTHPAVLKFMQKHMPSEPLFAPGPVFDSFLDDAPALSETGMDVTEEEGNKQPALPTDIDPETLAAACPF